MKFLAVLVVFLSFQTFAEDKVVYQCLSGSRSFTIVESETSGLVGYYQNFTGGPEQFSCKLINSSKKSYVCTAGDYVVKTHLNAHGNPIVDFLLKGDFYPDSGHLYALYCESNQEEN